MGVNGEGETHQPLQQCKGLSSTFCVCSHPWGHTGMSSNPTSVPCETPTPATNSDTKSDATHVFFLLIRYVTSNIRRTVQITVHLCLLKHAPSPALSLSPVKNNIPFKVKFVT